MKYFIIEKDKSYTFSDYFKLDPPIDDLLDYFGYSHEVEKHVFSKMSLDIHYFSDLALLLEQHIRYVNLTSDIARRESLIAPVLLKIAVYLKMRVEIEYSIKVNHQLKGKIDYYLPQENNMLIVEAKKGDLQRGFTQLAVELIALDKWLDEDEKPIFGAVTVGDIWRFGILNRQTKRITQDMNLFRVPADLDELLQVLLAILS
ncbi:MAG: hypothetical protein B6242_10155 [Anaerolineaceae bacterium 4572_78]|nr:MAG: hypothetical protein B6242_10155 [Anaerolineaceae bacterium 4572_78]